MALSGISSKITNFTNSLSGQAQPPTTQKDSSYIFILNDTGGTDFYHEHTLLLNPEDLVHSMPSRSNVVQTLGNPFIDTYGLGIQSLQIRGTTGWNTRQYGAYSVDGLQAFQDLKINIYQKYHELREQAVETGDDPNDVELRFITPFETYDVHIESFTLRRNKTRPLLFSYDIQMKILFDYAIDKPDPLPDEISKLLRDPKTRSLLAQYKIRQGVGALNAVSDLFRNNGLGGIADFIDGGTEAYTMAAEFITEATEVASAVTGLAGEIADAAKGVMEFIQDPAGGLMDKLGLNDFVKEVAFAYREIADISCTLHNVPYRPSFTDLADLFGNSNCGYTLGAESNEAKDNAFTEF